MPSTPHVSSRLRGLPSEPSAARATMRARCRRRVAAPRAQPPTPCRPRRPGVNERILRKPAICAPAPGGDFRRGAGAPAILFIPTLVPLHKQLAHNNSQQASAEARPCPCFIGITIRHRCVTFIALGIRQSSDCCARRCPNNLSSATTARALGERRWARLCGVAR